MPVLCDRCGWLVKKKATRSLPANAYYWACVVGTLAEHTGYTPDEMHEVLKAKFLPKTLAVQDKNGEIVGEFVIGGSTVKLNTTEFSDYVRDIKTWAREQLDVEIPDADGLTK